MAAEFFNVLQSFSLYGKTAGKFYSLPQLEKKGVGRISRLPVSLRIILESLLRHGDGSLITREDIEHLARWEPQSARTREIPFIVSRILLQDFTGVPLLVDLAAMRSAVKRLGRDPAVIEPSVPVDLVIDHSIQVDFTHHPQALQMNMEIEFKRNQARYRFLKWGTEAFRNFRVIPPGIGICHQVNLEYLASVVTTSSPYVYPDTLVGTDSHTTMINGLGVLGWGLGGIEAEAGMLGQPICFLTPDVIGVLMKGRLREGVTATDLVLHVTELLRKENVVGKFVEYFGEGASELSVPDRATIANMAPEYGATIGFFPVDERTCDYLLMTGRSPQHVDLVRNYYEAQGLFGIPREGDCDYSDIVEIDLSKIEPSVSGPRRPQDRMSLSSLKESFLSALKKPVPENGYSKTDDEIQKRYKVTMGIDYMRDLKGIQGGGDQAAESVPASVSDVSHKDTNSWTEWEMMTNRPTPDRVLSDAEPIYKKAFVEIGHGDVFIAAITSCTNTSNPAVMIMAGLVAKKAVEMGLSVPLYVKTSLAPGSRAVSEYFGKSGLQKYLDQLGFALVGYGCTTCIGNSGPLDPSLEEVILKQDLIGVSVLSGNRNFEARIHQSIKANFLMSPPLVVAYALAGNVLIDLTKEPLGKSNQGKPVYLRDLWPSPQEIEQYLPMTKEPQAYQRLYRNVTKNHPLWSSLPTVSDQIYPWEPDSTYIQEPPFFDRFSMTPPPVTDIRKARVLAIFGDSVTTDHISPAGSIKPASPAGQYLLARGVKPDDFNSYGARRGNDQVMTRGMFSNVRLRNLMIAGAEGGMTIHQPEGAGMSLFDAAMRYRSEGVPLIIMAGREYGTGSSRDWAAKGTALLGVRAVIAQSFERIHRSNLVGMGVLPFVFEGPVDARSLGLNGSEIYDISGIEKGIVPQQRMTLTITRSGKTVEKVPIRLRIDTPIEVEYFRHGGILPYVLRQL